MDTNDFILETEENTTEKARPSIIENRIEPFTENEETDYSKINVFVGKQNLPTIFLWGPASAGKSVAIIRLANYLKDQNFNILFDQAFRTDAKYKKLKNIFEGYINQLKVGKTHSDVKNIDFSNLKIDKTSSIDYFLFQIADKNNKEVCQVLEAPGEAYFSESNANSTEIDSYVRQLMARVERKLYIIFLELNWEDQESREQYSRKIANQLNLFNPKKDGIILLLNKVNDLERFNRYFENGSLKTEKLLKDIKPQYKPLFDKLDGSSKFSIFSNKSFKYDVIGFAGANFNSENTYATPAEDVYPKKLWDLIMKKISGSIW